jgi:hypothetical protein
MSIVAQNKSFDVYLTGNPPTQLRFRLLYANANFKTLLSMHYFTSMRIDVYVNDKYVAPTNAEFKNGQMTVKDPNSNLASYMPTYANASGSNLYLKSEQKVYFTLAGGDYIDLRIAPVLFVKFGVPAITADEFFDPTTLVQNFADLLGIPASKIKSVNIVRATRSRRQVSGSTENYVTFEISEDPVQALTNQTKFDLVQDGLQKLTAQITSQFMTGELQEKAKEKLNIDLSSFLVQKPPASPTENVTLATVNKVSQLVVVQQASGCRAQSPCDVQPILKVLDQNV